MIGGADCCHCLQPVITPLTLNISTVAFVFAVHKILDMLFGTFKTAYFDNVDALWEWRQNNHGIKSTITRNDIGLLIYGSLHSDKRREDASFPLLRNCVEETFNVERVQRCWNHSLGLYPIFSRAALKDRAIRHEVIVDAAGIADTEMDPEAEFLQEQNGANLMSCELLDAAGFGGEQFLCQLPEYDSQARKEAVTAPRSRARQDIFQRFKAGTGNFFKHTGGAAINDDDMFISLERAQLMEKLDTMEAEKKKRSVDVSREADAWKIIESEKGDAAYLNPELKVLIAWKLGKACPSKVSLRKDRLALWLELKGTHVPKAVPWSEDEELAMEELQMKIDGDIPIEETAYGRQLTAEQQKARSVLLAMAPDEREALLSQEESETTAEMTDASARSHDCDSATISNAAENR